MCHIMQKSIIKIMQNNMKLRLFVLFDLILYVQQSFSYVGTGLPGLNQYLARINVSCSRSQPSDAGEVGAALRS